MECVLQTDIFNTLGTRVNAVAVLCGTVNVTRLLQIPFCWILTTPLTAFDATLATTCVSLQLVTIPLPLPIQTAPLPCVSPKPFPLIVTTVSALPAVGLTFATCGKSIVKETELLHTPFCRI